MIGLNTPTHWRILLLLWILLSLTCLAAIAVYGQPLWTETRPLARHWEREAIGPLNLLDSPPRWLSMAGALLSSGLCGILVMYTFPGPIRHMGETFYAPLEKLARLALAGLAVVILIAALSLSATLAMGTFPLALFLGGVLFLASYAGMVALAYALGNVLLRRADWGYLSPVVTLLLGTFLLFTLSELPILGILFKLLFVFLGAGVIVTTRFGTGQPWSLESFREE